MLHTCTSVCVCMSVSQVLMDELPKLLSSLAFKKSMRWRGDTAFSRPVRWLLALHGPTVVPFVWGGLQAGNTTRLLRNATPNEATVCDCDTHTRTQPHVCDHTCTRIYTHTYK